jgi:hypothetical protein
VLALLAMNGLVAFAGEHQAANAIAALKQRLAATARALRDGAWTSLPVRELVPGDVIRIRLGDVAPADARLPGREGPCQAADARGSRSPDDNRGMAGPMACGKDQCASVNRPGTRRACPAVPQAAPGTDPAGRPDAAHVQAMSTAITRQHEAEGHPVTAATRARVRATLVPR